MDNYSYPPSYPDSGDSSPRSREIEFDNPSPWEESNAQQQQNYKVKFMCSYGGKIHPRPHDNQLSYIGGETKILAVDRNIKFASLIAKLAVMCDYDSVLFKYQLPGEDLDSLISVTNDDDLEHMMHEYDRLYKASPKPARLRLFLFPANSSLPSAPTVVGTRSFGSDDKSEKERFVEALNSGPVQNSTPASTVASPPPPPASGNVDFLLSFEKGTAPAPPQQQPPPPPVVTGKLRDPVPDPPIVHEHEIPIPGFDDRMMAPDPIQKHIQDLQRLRLEEQRGIYHRRKSDDNLAGPYPMGANGDYYAQNVPEKVPPVTVPGNVTVQATGYWQEKQVGGGGLFPTSTLGTDPQVYMIPAPSNAYHAPMVRPMTGGPTGQGGYYTLQRLPTEMYRGEQQVYNVIPSMPAAVSSVAAAPPSLPSQGQAKTMAYSEGYGMMRPVTAGGGVGMVETGYQQQQQQGMAYDNGVGRQFYYTAQGGAATAALPAQPQAPPQQQVHYQAMAAAVSGVDVKAMHQEAGKADAKATQASI